MTDNAETAMQERERSTLMQTAHWWRERCSQADMSAADHSEFEHWLQSDIQHAAAFERASLVWEALGAIPAEDYGAEIRRETWFERLHAWILQPVQPNWLPFSIGKTIPVAGLAAILSIGIVLLGQQHHRGDSHSTAMSYATAVGAKDAVTLSDGSLLTLGPGSYVDIRFDQNFRDIHLKRGAVMVEVASDTDRPLQVIAGDLRARAVGTHFAVKRATEISRVEVAEGTVRVSFPVIVAGKPGAVRNVEKIGQGEQIAALHHEGLQQIEPIRPASVGAWRDNRLDYVRATVTELVDDLSRMSDTQVSIEDPEHVLAETTFSAYFDASDVAALVKKLPAVLPVEVHTDAGGALTIRPIKTHN
ncbi:MAG: FecR domain-containing protein [Pseudomonadota bacterium]